jgi:hypothetical protein
VVSVNPGVTYYFVFLSVQHGPTGHVTMGLAPGQREFAPKTSLFSRPSVSSAPPRQGDLNHLISDPDLDIL